MALLRLAIEGVLVCGGALSYSSAWSMGLPVTSCADDGGSGTLRSVVNSAQDGDVVYLSELPLECSTISLKIGAVGISVPNLTIKGDPTRLITVMAYRSRVLQHTGTGTLVLKYLGVTHGSTPGNSGLGGCIYSAGNVTLFADDDVSYCQAIGGNGTVPAKGGAIFAKGSVSVMNSRVTYGYVQGSSQNFANRPLGGNIYAGGSVNVSDSEISDGSAYDYNGQGNGGGIASAQSITVNRSLIVGNSASHGGGIYIHSSGTSVPSKISESTIVDNRADQSGGGIYVGVGTVTIENSTLSGNINNGIAAAGSFTLASSIVFGSEGYDISVQPQAVILGDHNLVGTASNFNQLPAGTLQLDPQLGTLGYYGGRWRSVPLLRGSPAIDAGSNPDNQFFDQRDAERVVGPAPDIGSFEFDPDVVFRNGFD